MAFTEHSDVFGRVHEEGVNRVVRHLLRQRPALFNYATAYFLARPDELCHPIEAHPEVTRRGNPLFTVERPLPLPGTDGRVGLDFCVQLVEVELDLHPTNVFALPDELGGKLGEQGLALRVQVCAGINCPDPRALRRYEPAVRQTPLFDPRKEREDRDDGLRPPPLAVPSRGPACFCLELFAAAHLERASGPQGPELAVRLDGLELVDVRPEGLENSLECYLATLLRLTVLPRVRVALSALVLELTEFITLVPTPLSGPVPHNPSVAEDAVSVFLDLA